MKITKSNNIGFDYLEYETIIEALYYYGQAKKNYLALNKHLMTASEIEYNEEKIERAKALQKELFKAKSRYMDDLTNW